MNHVLFKKIAMNNLARKTAEKTRKATNVSIDESLLAEAKVLKINVSRAAEAGLAFALAGKRAELWLAENRSALESSNAYIDQHGLPLGQYREF